MPCGETLNTQAYIDGEIGGDEAAAAEHHLETCAECQAFVANAASLSDGIRRYAPRYHAPDALRARVAEALGQEVARVSSAANDPGRATPRGFWFGALSGAGITGLAAAVATLTLLPPTADSLADNLTDAHTRALMAGHEIEVVSTDHHTVKPWFAGRIAVSPPVTDFAAQGFKLVGGRLDRVGGRQAAVVVYKHGLHEIDLYVWADQGAALPRDGVRHGYHMQFWKAGDLDFAAISDTQPSELTTFANLVRAEPE